MPLAPGWLSTTTGWPSSGPMCSLSIKATMWTNPPEAKGTTSVIGLAG